MSKLEIAGITHRYPSVERDAIRNVSLTVPDGQMVSIVGPSGSGKSTVLRVAAGLETAHGGQILVDDADVTALPTERRNLTVMFQQPHLFDHLDVGGNVGFAPRLAGSSRADARQCARRYLRLVHLEGYERRSVAALSGGQQQRVALARALAAERGVMLLDEPFSSLDRELRGSMHDLLGELRSALSPTIVMITHDLDEAALADSTVVLIDGEVHQHGPTADLHREPATLAVARLVGGFTEIAGTVEGGAHHSAWGRVPLSDRCRALAGPGTLLLRQEELEVRQLVGAELPGAALRGTISRVRPSGPRQVVTVQSEGSGEVKVELPPGQHLDLGACVAVSPQTGVRGWALPASQESATSAVSTPHGDEAADAQSLPTTSTA